MAANEPYLEGRRIFLVEDNYGIAKVLSVLFRLHGAHIVGPSNTVESAIATLAEEKNIDAAILDVRVRNKTIYPVAELLRKQHVPMLFVTGCDERSISQAFADVPCVMKPWNAEHLVSMLLKQIAGRVPVST